MLSSLPTWERELKLFLAQALGALTRLLPTWERELKRIKPISQIKEEQLLPPWECELKPSLLKCFTAAIYYHFLQGSVS